MSAPIKKSEPVEQLTSHRMYPNMEPTKPTRTANFIKPVIRP